MDLEEFLDKLEPALRTEVLRMFASVRDSVTVAEVEALISAGRIQEAMDKIIPPAEMLSAAWIRAYVNVATATGIWLSREIGVHVIFDQVNERAVRAMQNNSLRLVQNLTTAQRDAVREALLEGIRQGINPRQSAIAVRSSIGLTARQMRAVNAYRRALESGGRSALTRALRDKRFDRTVLSAAERNIPLSQAQITKMVNAYIRKQLRHRSEVIARTEALRSVHEGNEEMMRQALDSGALSSADITNTWNTARDARVRDSHVTMEGQQRPWGEPFVSGAGNLLRFPGDLAAPPEEVIQCFPPGTVVRTDGIVRAYRREYSGKLVTIQAGNNHLTTTPNHPVLTLRGWIPAREITDADYLLNTARAKDLASPVDPEARIEDVFDALSESDPRSVLRLRPRAVGLVMDFHGEIPGEDVYVVGSDRVLPNRTVQSAKEVALDDPDLLLGVKLANRLLGQGALPHDGASNGSSIGLPLFRAHSARPQQTGLSAGSRSQSQVLEAEDDGPSPDGHLQDRHPGPVHRENGRQVNRPLFLPVRVTSTSHSLFSGNVYNLETQSGLILSNNLVSHNCRCVRTSTIKLPTRQGTNIFTEIR